MPDRWRRSRVLLGSVLAMFACDVDEASTLEIVVRAEAPAQVAAGLPAQVLVGFDSSGAGYVVFRVGFLCAPGAPFVTTARFSDSSGGGATAVDAWLVPLDPGSPFTCGPLGAPQPISSPGPRAGLQRTSAQVEVLAACGAGDVRTATLVIGGTSP